MKTPIERGVSAPAWDAYRAACKAANIDIEARDDKRITQAIGTAAASAGFHFKDGTLNGQNYSAAIDLSVRDLSKSQIATWLEELCGQGFVAFYRNWPGNLHIHGNFCGVPMKRQLDRQNEDFFAGRDGLVGHSRITQEWWYPELERRLIPQKMFAISNGASPRVCTRADVVKVPQVPPTYALYVGNDPKPRLWMPVEDGVSMAPVRAWGAIMGFDVQYDPKTHSVEFDGNDSPIAVKLIAGVGHAPLRQLASEAGLYVVFDPDAREVTVTK